MRIGERGKRQEIGQMTREPIKGRPPPHASTAALLHGTEDGVPSISFHVGPPVFIHPFPWATVFFSNLDGFANFEVVVQFFLVFVCHGFDDFEVGGVEWLITVFVVLAYATV